MSVSAGLLIQAVYFTDYFGDAYNEIHRNKW
jgi:hypothetical protein